MLVPGARIGSYEVEARIGGGGMGEVFLAHDRRLGRRVALKVLKRTNALSAQRLARLTSEARTLAALNHPNVATLHDIEQQGDVHILVLEFIDGDTLRERLAEGALAVREALAIALQITAALEAAHEHGIVHCDLKPENIKLRTDGTVKVLDFDIARTIDDGARALAHDDATITADSGAMIGTVAYMSPEQARGLAVDRRADIWSFGCVLYEMLSGERAFPGGSADALVAVLTRDPDYARISTATPAPVTRLLRRCLVKNARERLRDIGDARIELRDALAEAGAPHVSSLRHGLSRRVTLGLIALAVLAALTTGAILRYF